MTFLDALDMFCTRINAPFQALEYEAATVCARCSDEELLRLIREYGGPTLSSAAGAIGSECYDRATLEEAAKTVIEAQRLHGLTPMDVLKKDGEDLDTDCET